MITAPMEILILYWVLLLHESDFFLLVFFFESDSRLGVSRLDIRLGVSQGKKLSSFHSEETTEEFVLFIPHISM